MKLTRWQRVRLYIETHPPFAYTITLAVICWGLAIVGIRTHRIDIFGPILVAVMLINFLFFLAVDKKTSNWWYHEYHRTGTEKPTKGT